MNASIRLSSVKEPMFVHIIEIDIDKHISLQKTFLSQAFIHKKSVLPSFGIASLVRIVNIHCFEGFSRGWWNVVNADFQMFP